MHVYMGMERKDELTVYLSAPLQMQKSVRKKTGDVY